MASPKNTLADTLRGYDCLNNSVDLKQPNRRIGKFPSNFQSLHSNVSLQGDYMDRTLEPEPETAGMRYPINRSMCRDFIDKDSSKDLRIMPQNSGITSIGSKPISNVADCGIPNRPVQHTRSMSRRNQQ